LRDVFEVGGDVVDRRNALRDPDQIAEIEDEAERHHQGEQVGQHQLRPPPRHDEADEPEDGPGRGGEEEIAERGQPGPEPPQAAGAADGGDEGGEDRAESQHDSGSGNQAGPVPARVSHNRSPPGPSIQAFAKLGPYSG
jgi:hypothetical protein